MLQTIPAKKSAALDVEPVYTFRAHTGKLKNIPCTNQHLLYDSIYLDKIEILKPCFASFQDRFYLQLQLRMVIIVFRVELMLRYGVGTCPIQLLIRMIPMVMQNCLRYNSTFSIIFAPYKWALRYLTTHSKPCLIFPSRSQCIGSHVNRTHGRSLEPFISGRKSSATTISICRWYG